MLSALRPLQMPMRQLNLKFPVLFCLFFLIANAVPAFSQKKPSTSNSPLKFTDVTKEAGLYHESSGWSATFVDFDEDGWLDLHLINRLYEPSILYRNNGDGTFSDATEASGLRFKTNQGHVTWVDLDNDGDKDCLTAGINQDEIFLNDGDGTFTSLGSLFQRAGTGRQGRLAIADYNNDGFLDIFVCQTDRTPQRHSKDRGLLFKVLGDGTFEEVGETAGLSNIFDAYAALWLDFNQDGWPDLIASSLIDPFLKAFLNLGNEPFRDVTEEVGLTNVAFDHNDTPVLSTMDMNRDGWLDLIVGGRNLQIFVNQKGKFNLQLVEDFLPSLSGHVNSLIWGDIDNDAWLDLFLPQADSIRAWRGKERGGFNEISSFLNIRKAEYRYHGLNLGDYDNDGDLDLFLAKGGVSTLYRNDSPGQNWLKIDLHGTTGNADGLGVRVELFAGELRQTINTGMGTVTGSKTAGDLHFGLGDKSIVDSIRVFWSSKQVLRLTNVEANQTLTLKEPRSVLFEEIAEAAGISGAWSTRGAAFGDYDNDGFLDLVVNRGISRLFHNNSDQTFTDVAEQAGVYGRNNAGVAWGDFNNDSRLDFFITQTSSLPHRLLLGSQDSTFVDVSLEAGVALVLNGGPVLLADFDRDGFLDVMIAGGPVQLFFNQGDTTFIESGQEAGFDRIRFTHLKYLLGCLGDYDNDGDIDVYLTQTNWSYKRHNAPNYLFRNRGDGTFEDVTELAGVADSSNSKSAVFADYNNDGYLDLYVVTDGGDNRLFRNNGDGSFSDIASQAGVTGPFAAHSANFGDFDNDGDLDLYVSGASYLQEDSLEVAFGPLPDVLYRNDGFDSDQVWKFTDITQEAGIQNLAHCLTAIWGDIDNDGDLDLFLGNNDDLRGRSVSDAVFNFAPFPPDKLYRNRGNGNHYLHLQLVGHTSNRAALGTRVEAYAGALFQIREVEGGGVYQSQNSLPIEFGFGRRDQVDKVIIRWPSGIVQELTTPALDQLLVVEEPFRFGFIQMEQATLARVRGWLPRIAWGAGGLFLVVALVLGIRHGVQFIRKRVPGFGLSYLRKVVVSSPGGLKMLKKRGPATLAHPGMDVACLKIKIKINLIEFRDDYLLTHTFEPVAGPEAAFSAFSAGRQEKHPYTLRSEKIRHLKEDLAEVFRMFERYILHGDKSEVSPLEELREIGYRIYRFFGMGGFFSELFALKSEQPFHLDFDLDSLEIPWQLAFDKENEGFLFERFPYGISFATERKPLTQFRGAKALTDYDSRDKGAVLFYGDWSGSKKALKEVTAETHDVEKILCKAGLAVHLVYQNIDAFVEAILKIQEDESDLRVIHYSGHVEGNTLAAGKDDYLAAGFLKDAFGLTFNSKPVVFLNGCSSGAVLDLGNKYKNLATEFLACGASACIVTDFPVPETSARNFAQRFYRHFVGSNETVGESLCGTRLEMASSHFSGMTDPEYDITRFFYNLYGDPTAKL